MADESFDFENKKKIANYVRTILPVTFTPTTHYLESCWNCWRRGVFKWTKSLTLEVMEHKSGVITQLKEIHTEIVCVHCLAHRLNLATYQAASSVNAKKFQEMLTSIFFISSQIQQTVWGSPCHSGFTEWAQAAFHWSAFSPLDHFLISYGNHVLLLCITGNISGKWPKLKYEGLARKPKQFWSLAILHLRMEIIAVKTERFPEDGHRCVSGVSKCGTLHGHF